MGGKSFFGFGRHYCSQVETEFVSIGNCWLLVIT